MATLPDAGVPTHFSTSLLFFSCVARAWTFFNTSWAEAKGSGA